MNKLQNIKEFTKEELQEQLKNKKIDVDFLLDYTIKRDKVYNELINKVNELTKKNKSLLSNVKDQYETNKILAGRLYNAIAFVKEHYLTPTENETHLINKIDQRFLLEILGEKND